MKVFTQSDRSPSQILFAFDEVADSAVNQIRWAVAYSTRSGCARLIDRVSERVGQARWDACPKHFITSIDYGLTDPNALEFLAHIPCGQVHIANPDVIDHRGFFPSRAYHPKMYLFDSEASTGYVVGSANMTASALITNTEVVTVGREAPQSGQWDTIWAELLSATTPLTPEFLRRYRQRWRRPKQRAVDPDPRPRPRVIRPVDKPVFWDAVTAGGVAPEAFNHFWIEAGSMSSGGSHNQLELPRGANRFFGFRHTDYGETHITIGHPVLTVRSASWRDRPLTWHGNNRMERINLPTHALGGFDYRDTAVLFRRLATGFEIDVLHWNDEGAIAWRAASDVLNTVFRLGARGDRICGLF